MATSTFFSFYSPSVSFRFPSFFFFFFEKMPRDPTNSLILTNLSQASLDSPNELVSLLSNENDLIELVILSKLSRIILICESASVAIRVKAVISQHMPHVNVSFSIKDNNFDINKAELDSATTGYQEKTYLELPHDLNLKRFLISPPMSPQGEWNDWGKMEEGPNQVDIYSPEELSNLLWQRLGNTSMVEKVHLEPKTGRTIDLEIEPELLFNGIDNGVPAIILDKADHELVEEKLPKTSMPPV